MIMITGGAIVLLTIGSQ